jgi:hypothetical protein
LGVGIYGTLGEGTTSTMPGGRQEGTSWVDEVGRLWLFGGFGYDRSSSYLGSFSFSFCFFFLNRISDGIGRCTGLLGDLWMYDIEENTWTWMHGSQTAGTPGSNLNDFARKLFFFFSCFPHIVLLLKECMV